MKKHSDSDEGRDEVDKELDRLERKLAKEYKKAYRETKEKAGEFFKRFQEKDSNMLQKLKDGQITQEKYQEWREHTLTTNKRYNDLCENLARDYSNTNKIAKEMINDSLPTAYAISANYGTYEIEHGIKADTSFTMYDPEAVRLLAKENPRLYKKAGLDVPKDLRWNKQKINSVLTQGILQGESVDKIAQRLAKVAQMNEASALRNARTLVNGAENAGRQHSYERLSKMGIKLQKVWIAQLDDRTRHSHAVMDGEIIDIDSTFSNGCRFPGDPEADPEEYYNCRCREQSVVKGSDLDYYGLEGIERDNRLGDMTYDEWKEMHAEKYKEQQERKQR